MDVCCKVFEDVKLYNILFKKNDNDILDKEQYLEILLLFIPEKETQQILKVIKKYLKDNSQKNKILEKLENILGKIDLKTEAGFHYLKDIILQFIKDSNHFLDLIQEIEKRYVFNNNMLRCRKCLNLPIFSINQDKIINISYRCNHMDLYKNELEKLEEVPFNCCCCNELLLISNKNYICSNCKNIFCNAGLNEHFPECGTVFFIPINEIDNICPDHDQKYSSYCGICNINLCQKCCLEHFHCISQKKQFDLDEVSLIKINDFIRSDNKNNKIILSSIESIIKDKKYDNNFQFLYFINEIIGNKIKIDDILFEEFFNIEFKKYYDYIINQTIKKNYYYFNVLQNLRENYTKINQDYYNFKNEIHLSYLDNKIKIMNSNNMRFTLLSSYFNKINELKAQKQIFDNKNEIEKGLIKIEENKILITSILNSETLYQTQLLKLINRSLADNIIVYLIENYPNKFQKIKFNLNIFADLQKYYKKEPEKFDKIRREKQEEINEFKSNNEENNNNEDNKIIFKESITIKNSTIEVSDLNHIVQFLFFMKQDGDFVAHPKNIKDDENNENIVIKHNTHNLKSSGNYNDINEEKLKIQKFIEEVFCKNTFDVPVKVKAIFDCLFEYKFKALINSEYDDEFKNKIDNLFNEISNIDVKEDVIKNFESYTEKIKQLEKICSSLEEKNKLKKDLEIPKPLEKFFERLKNIINNEQKCLTFLYNINKNEYESSITGENYCFLDKCFNYLIKNITVKIEDNLKNYKKIEEKMENLYEARKSIIVLLVKFNEKLKKMDEFNKPNFDLDEMKKYFNKGNANGDEKEINLNAIRENMEKLVKGKIDWTLSKKCKFSTLLYLKQNNS